ncbi:hypothetical protein, partial [Liquorilactobacillus sp.]|uniref:hypothetical protein n=1 Tax=Liquorilactobacillus sp. TaxID=2767923 RepID=UPI0039ECCD7E
FRSLFGFPSTGSTPAEGIKDANLKSFKSYMCTICASAFETFLFYQNYNACITKQYFISLSEDFIPQK